MKSGAKFRIFGIHSAAMVRRSAPQPEYFTIRPPMLARACLKDCALWRRVLTGHWKAAKQLGPQLYRQRGDNMHLKGRTEEAPFYKCSTLFQEPVTICVATTEVATHLADWEDTQTHPNVILNITNRPKPQTVYRLIIDSGTTQPDYAIDQLLHQIGPKAPTARRDGYTLTRR